MFEHDRELLKQIAETTNETREILVATQEEVQELVTTVDAIKTDLETAKTTIESEFAELEKQIAEGKTGGEVNLTPLSEAIASLTPQAQALEQLKANPPAAAPVAGAGVATPGGPAGPGALAEGQAPQQAAESA